MLGQHTREFLNELGLTDAQIEKLLLDGTVKEKKLIQTRYKLFEILLNSGFRVVNLLSGNRIMNKENIDIIKAEGELIELYADDIPELAWSTGPASYEYYMKRRSLFDAWVQRLWRASGTIFSSDSAILSIEEGKLLGVAIAFNGGKYRERIRAGGPLWDEMLKAKEVTSEEIAGVTERAKLASWLNPVIHSNTFYVHALAVKHEARGKRVGYSMMEYLFDKAKELGYQEFQLDVLSDNPAVGFYRSLGLEVLAETRAPKPAEFGVPIEFRMGKILD